MPKQRTPPAPPAPIAPPVAALALLGAWALLLFAAPPHSNAYWAFDGFRSVSPEARFGLVLVSIGIALIPLFRLRSPALAWGIGVAVAVLIAFPLRERIHFLGDSQLRLRSIAAFGAGLFGTGAGEWSRKLHANPLDIALNFFATSGLSRLGLTVLQSVSVLSLALALAWFAGLWRLCARLAAPAPLRLSLCAALALTGALEAFAGYAESAALLLAAAAWWWAELLAPIGDRARAARAALAWLVLALVHRIALVMLVPQLWRALGPALPGDDPKARRLMLALSLGAAVLAVGVLLGGSGARLLADDWHNLIGATPGRSLPHLMGAADAANTLLLLAPLALLAGALAGLEALRGWVAKPESRLLMAAAIPLLIIGPMLPVGTSGFGAHRDWDLNLLLGFTLTLAAGSLLALLPAPRLRGALTVTLPVLALAASSWVAVNADEGASIRRVLALAADPGALAEPQRGTLHEFLGQRAMNLGQAQAAGAYYDRAFEIGGNRRRLLLAAEAWVAAGDTAAARRSLARARAGDLSPELERAATKIEALIAPASDSAAGPPRTP